MIESSPRVLVTGGRGFLGSALVARLAECAEVVVLDVGDRPAPAFAPLAGHPAVTSLEGDVTDEAAVRRAIDRCGAVLHLAAVAGVHNYHARPVRTLEVNLLGTRNVLAAAAARDGVRVITFSSSEVYGAHATDAREDAPTSLGPAGVLRWSYAAGKVAADHLAAAYHAERGLAVTSIRPFNVYGPGQVGEGAVHAFAVRALLGEQIAVTGDGLQSRAWCYVDDLVEAVLRVLETPAAVGTALNVGNAEAVIGTRALAEQIRELARSASPIVGAEHVGVDVRDRSPDVERIHRLTGWRAQVGLADGLARTIAWYRDRGEDELREMLRWLDAGAPHADAARP